MGDLISARKILGAISKLEENSKRLEDPKFKSGYKSALGAIRFSVEEMDPELENKWLDKEVEKFCRENSITPEEYETITKCAHHFYGFGRRKSDKEAINGLNPEIVKAISKVFGDGNLSWEETDSLFDEFRRVLGIQKRAIENDFKEIVGKYVAQGDKCMNDSEDDQGAYTFWDGSHNCAQAILRELEDEE